MKVKEVFVDELQLIKSQEIKNFVLECFNKFCPDYFWTVSCSSTGKYHPAISLGEGGLVRHTKLAIWWGEELLKTWPMLPNTAHDEVIAALLLHDILKRGKTENDLDTFETHAKAISSHGIYAAKQITELYGPQLNENQRLKRVVTAIRDHMGKWTGGSTRSTKDIVHNTKEGHVVCITVHLADYCASRKVDDKVLELAGVKDESVGDLVHSSD